LGGTWFDGTWIGTWFDGTWIGADRETWFGS